MGYLQFITDLTILSNTLMNKDALLATLIGFGIGLLITGVLLAGPNLLRMLPPIHWPTISFSTQKNTPNPTPTPKTNGLSIESPLPDTIENSTDLLVTGAAVAGSTVVITGASDESVVMVKDDSKYAGKVTLVEGKNDITVTAYVAGKPTAQTVTVYYTQETL